jgi:3-(3-hydroxy-phenyl)propionate hydroxylase
MNSQVASRDSTSHYQPRSMDGYELPIYPFRTPPELKSGKQPRYPVVIAGGGLTGLTLGLDLGLRGIPVVIVDEDDNVGAFGLSSRGVVYVERTLEIFERLGVARRVVEKGVGWSSGRVFKGDDEVYSFLSKGADDTFIPPYTNLQQFFVEQYLVDRISEVDNIDLRWKSRVVAVSSHDDHATLKIDTPEGAYELETDWLAACDGGNSFIRNSLNVPSQIHLFEDVWCIADIRANTNSASERRMWLDADFNDGGVVLNHQLADGVCRFNCQISHYPDIERAGGMDEIHRRLRRALGEDAAYEMVWAGVWRYKRRLTDRFVDGRVVYLGDAAHQVPPFGARGGNTGIADADNLGWKLALVLGGHADRSLIESYHSERYVAAVENIEVTNRSALFLTPDTPARRLFRDAVLDLARRFPEVRPMVNTGRLAVAQSYPASPLNIGGDWSGSDGLPPGSPFVNGRIVRPDGTTGRLLELVDGAFVALHFLPDRAELPREVESASLAASVELRSYVIARSEQNLPLPAFVDPDGALFKAYGADGGATYLLRPDGHVIARSRQLQVPPTPDFLRASGSLECAA